MLSKAYSDFMYSNRQLDFHLKNFKHVKILNKNYYYECLLPDISKICNDNHMKEGTKYLVKKALDTYILKNPSADTALMRFVAINFFRMAIKFNEDHSVYSGLSIEESLKFCDRNRFSIENALQFQRNQINGTFKFSITTPYDYLHLFPKEFEFSPKLMQVLKEILNFSLFIPSLMYYSAEELFFGSMLQLFKMQKLPTQWLMSQTHSKEDVLQVNQIIILYYDYYSADEMIIDNVAPETS